MGHLQANGFEVDVRNVDNATLSRVKAEHGIPGHLQGCHTGEVDGYFVEGHVPADLVAKLLEERPEVKGLTVPGMPVGSPGMEGPNPGPYDVYAMDESGQAAIYARR